MNLYDFLTAKKYMTISEVVTIFVPKMMEAKEWNDYDDFWRMHETIKEHLIEKVRVAVEEKRVRGKISYFMSPLYADEDGSPLREVDLVRSYVQTANVIVWATRDNLLTPPTAAGKDDNNTGSTRGETRDDIANIIKACVKATAIGLKEDIEITKEMYHAEMKDTGLKGNLLDQIWTEIGDYRSKGGRPRILDTAIKAAVHAGMIYAENELVPRAVLTVEIQKENKGIKTFIVDRICKEIERLQAHKR